MPKLFLQTCRLLCHTSLHLWRAGFVLMIFLFQTETVQAVVRYVRPGSAGTAPYTSWATASNDLQAVINASVAGDEIWIAAGTYRPNRRADALTVVTPTDRNNAFVLKSSVKIYGGFNGTETLLSQRNPSTNIVTFSGDIGTLGANSDNCYHVVISANLSGTTTLLDGVTISAGNANASTLTPSITVNTYSISPRNGGGMYKVASNTDITNCIFRRNDAVNAGAGIYETLSTVNSVYANCTITQNVSAGDGGGMFLFSSSCLFQNCIFSFNDASDDGAGIFWSGSSSPEFTKCTISSNDAVSEGGGMYLANGAGSPTLDSCIITSNSAGGNGGGISNYCGGTLSILFTTVSGNVSSVTGGGLFNSNSPAELTNCLLTGNLAASGGGIWNSFSDAVIINCSIAGNRATAQGGGMGNGSSNPVIRNTIIYGNTGVPVSTNALYNSGSTPSVQYCLVEGGYAGTGNVSGNPLFTSPLAPASAPVTGGNYRLQKCSPALNGGLNTSIPVGITTDLDDNPRIHYATVDIGAYERQLQTAIPDANGIVYVDITRSGDGSSWSNAVTELADAVLAAKFDSGIEEIWVAKGTYYPRYNNLLRNLDCNNSNPFNTFLLPPNIKLFGGFSGGETDTSGRNFITNETRLDGDFGFIGNVFDNCRIIVLNQNPGGSVVFNGFTVTNAYGPVASGMDNENDTVFVSNCRFVSILNNPSPGNYGGALAVRSGLAEIKYTVFDNNSSLFNAGAIHLSGLSAVVEACVFTNNEANNFGGAVYVDNGSQAYIKRCQFETNHANVYGGAVAMSAGVASIDSCVFISNSADVDGGAIVNRTGSVSTINNSLFEANNCNASGGAISNQAGSSVHVFNNDFILNTASSGAAIHIIEASSASSVQKNTFRGNTASLHGGGICAHISIELRNNLFSGNVASKGGGIHFATGGSMQVNNCTIVRNHSTTADGDAIYNTSPTGPVIRNSIVYDHFGTSLFSGPAPTVTYSLIQGGAAGTGNISANPLFVDPQPVSPIATVLGDYRLQKCSPAINAGSNALIPSGLTHDLDSNRRIAYAVVDMGAFEKVLARPDANGVVFVDSANTVNAGDGSSWSEAITEMADALKEAGDNSAIKEIWVAKGTYKPLFNSADAFKNSICNVTGRDDAFLMVQDVKLFGGFSGGEADTSGRNFIVNETVLSGDISIQNDSTDNAYHVLTSAGNVGAALLNGFTVTKGQGNGSGSIAVNGINITRAGGAGLICSASSPMISQCGFRNNTASLGGGAIRNFNGSAIQILDCLFSRNSTYDPSFNGGGAIEISGAGMSVIKNCLFEYNSTKTGGGAILDIGSGTTILHSRFYGNTANSGGAISLGLGGAVRIQGCDIKYNNANAGGGITILSGKIYESVISGNSANNGGGIYSALGTHEMVNCIISGNKASGAGGGVLANSSGSPNVVNCTISGNDAGSGGGVYLAANANAPNISNSIVWNNAAPADPGIFNASLGTQVQYSLIQGGYAGVGNYDIDPIFIDPVLPSSAPTILGNYRLQACSPALNAGNNSLVPSGVNNDLDSLTRIRYDLVDMGAFEKQDIDLANSTWKGINANWNDKINWCGGYVPYDTTNVIIPLTANQPVIGAGFSNAVKNISLATGTSLTVNNTSDFTINGTYSNSGSIIHNLGEWVMAGNAAAQLFPGSLGSITAMHNLRLKNPSGIGLNKSFSITGALIPEAGNIELINDTITLKSGAAATARIDSVRSGASFLYTGTGKFEIERYIPARKAWRLLTAPVNAYQSINADWQEGQTNLTLVNSNTSPGYGTHISGPQTGSGFDFSNTNNPSMMVYNQPSNTVTPIANTNVLTLNHQQGYMLFVHGSRGYDLTLNHLGTPDPTVLRSRGTIKTGDQPMPVAASGFTLVGNPYASSVDFDQLQRSNVGNKFTLWDPNRTGSYGYGGYVTFTKVGLSYVAAPPPVSAGIGQFIQSGAAFFVEGSGTAGAITFHEKSKVDNSVSTVFRSADSSIASIRINLIRIANSTGVQTPVDGTLAVFSEMAHQGADDIDAVKKMNDNQNIGLRQGVKVLAIEGRAPIGLLDTLYVNTSQMQQRSYVLECIPAYIHRPGLQAWLIDRYLNRHIQLSLTDTALYQFAVQSDAASAATDRFVIVFQQEMAGPVPVRFTSIRGECIPKAVSLQWSVAEQINIRNYTVEFSADGRVFDEAGIVPSQQQSAGTYLFVHTGNSGNDAYYRVRSNGSNGETLYSEVVFVPTCHFKTQITVYPNPVTDAVMQIHLENAQAGNYKLQLLNPEGKTVWKGSVTYSGGTRVYKVSVDQILASGQYLLRIIQDSGQSQSIPLLFR